MIKSASNTGVFIVLPVIFLLLFLFKLPFYIPGFLLKQRVFVSCNTRTDPDMLFDYLEKYSSLYLLSGGNLHPVKKSDFHIKTEFINYLDSFKKENTTVLNQYIEEITAQIPVFSKALIILNYFPNSPDLEAVQTIQGKYGIPVRIFIEPEHYDPLFMGSSYTYTPQEQSFTFEQLFSKRIWNYDSIRVFLNERLHQDITHEDLFEGTVYKTSIRNTADSHIRFELEKNGERITKTLCIKAVDEDKPSILLISSRPNRSVLEDRYALKKVSPAKILNEDLYKYPLLIFDSIPLNSYGTELTSILSKIYQKNTSSLLFISDGPDFGKKGDNPNIEKILPVELNPRSLKYLPDLNIFILLDISASMMGDKLSLAKVSTIELVKNLKSSDRITLLTFWDKHEYLYEFLEQKDINTEIDLSPLIARGGTDLYKALLNGLDRIIKMPPVPQQKHIIILSDGNTKESDFNVLIKKAALDDISISTMAVGEDINAELLKRLSQKTGGNYYRVLSMEEIPSLIFEDRKDISRSSFAQDNFTIHDFTEIKVSTVWGMNLYTPKEGRFVLYKNQYEDPLLLTEKRGKQKVLMFLSDIYGYYTESFFSNQSIWKTFKTIFDSVLKKNRIRLRIGEADRSICFTVTGEELLSPLLAVYSENKLIAETALKKGSFNSFTSLIQLPENGEYTAILYNRGTAFMRFPFYFNGVQEARDTGSQFKLRRFKMIPFKALKTHFLYLYLFFFCSVCITFLFRKKK